MTSISPATTSATILPQEPNVAAAKEEKKVLKPLEDQHKATEVQPGASKTDESVPQDAIKA